MGVYDILPLITKRGNMKAKKQLTPHEEVFPPIINGTYKKDNPDLEIGYQKWEVKKVYEVEMTYEIVAKTKEEAEDLLEKEEQIKLEEVDAYGRTFRETIKGQHSNDMQGDEPTTWKKIEECVPSEDSDIETNESFLNYEDPSWTTQEIEWNKNEDGTDIKKK
jgi:glucose-6-phosphate 1-dehydrogenase